MLLLKLGGSWLLPPRDFPHSTESHPMDHDSNSKIVRPDPVYFAFMLTIFFFSDKRHGAITQPPGLR